MGRRSRNRPSTDATRPAKPPRARSTDNLSPARKVIAGYLAAAGVIGVLTLLGIATLAGTFGPIIVFVVVLFAAVGVQRRVASRISGTDLTDEDRLMRLLATGVLLTAVVLAFVSAVVSLVAG